MGTSASAAAAGVRATRSSRRRCSAKRSPLGRSCTRSRLCGGGRSRLRERRRRPSPPPLGGPAQADFPATRGRTRRRPRLPTPLLLQWQDGHYAIRGHPSRLFACQSLICRDPRTRQPIIGVPRDVQLSRKECSRSPCPRLTGRHVEPYRGPPCCQPSENRQPLVQQTAHHRTSRKKDRTSSTNSSGCSNAAKCPPRAGSFQ